MVDALGSSCPRSAPTRSVFALGGRYWVIHHRLFARRPFDGTLMAEPVFLALIAWSRSPPHSSDR